MSPRFAIINPCAKRWTDLSGDGRKRFCDDCQTYVHALDQYSVQEFEELKRNSGRVCGFLAGESRPEPRSRRAILIGAFLTAISPLMAQSGRVRVRVTDVTGAVIPGAEVSLFGTEGNPLRTELANEMGEIVWNDLPIGESKINVTSRGFETRRLIVTVRNSGEVTVDAKLNVGTMGGAVEMHIELLPESPQQLTLPAPKMVAVPPPDVTSLPAAVETAPRPKHRWWQIFR